MIAEALDRDALDRDALFNEHLPLVPRVAKALLRGRRQWAFTLDDACSAGNEGLWRAAQRYAPSAGPFEKFASQCIANAIIDAARVTHRRRRGEVRLRERPTDGRDDAVPDAEAVPAPDESAEPGELLDLAAALESLSPEDREWITRRFGLDGGPALTFAKLGERFGLSKSPAVVRLHRILAKLRRAMA